MIRSGPDRGVRRIDKEGKLVVRRERRKSIESLLARAEELKPKN